MNAKAIGLLLYISCFIGCSSWTTEIEKPTNPKIPVQFGLQFKKEILPFPESKAIPSIDIGEPGVTNPPSVELVDLCKSIEYVVYDKATNKFVKHHQKNQGDDDFGIVYDTLPAGKYQVSFLAHSSLNAQQKENIISFNEISDMFYATKDIEVNSMDVQSDISLTRAVSLIHLVASDTIPNKLQTLSLSATGYPKMFDMLTGYGHLSGTEGAYVKTFSAEDLKKAADSISFLTLIPENNGLLELTQTAKDKDNNVLRTRTISKVSPEKGKELRYTGKLYSPANPDDTYKLEIKDVAWSLAKDSVLKD
ncbi:MAG: FimB/Mfa2 family fimbrial subunit [Tannerellaceae bacterium]